MTDRQLLLQYVQTASQEAFAQLVRMHVDVVYSAARRLARGDANLAEEITQQVFILLAQKAKSIGPDVLIGGWLYNSVRFVARDVIRKEQRRAHHESKAAAMANDMRNAQSPGGKQDAWEDAELVLDEAMGDLDEPTRGLLVERYFEGKTAVEVAQRLGISEDAARKRLNRAVDQLRGLFARRGVVLSTTALAEALAVNVITHAPAHVAASAASAAASSIAVAGATTTTAIAKTGAMLMAATKGQMIAYGVIGAIALSGAVAGGVKAVRYFAPVQARTVRIAPAGPVISGFLKDAAGKPVAGAEILICSQGKGIDVYQKTRGPAEVTAADGKFEFNKPATAYEVVFRNDAGIAQVSDATLVKSTDVRLQPWGRIEGRAMVGTKPMANVEIHTFEMSAPYGRETVRKQTFVKTDAEGKFVLPRIPPGEIRITPSDPKLKRYLRWAYTVVDPGQTVTLNIGGSGRAIVGKLTSPPDRPLVWDLNDKVYSSDAYLRLEFAESMSTPEHDPSETLEQYRAIEEEWGKTPIGAMYRTWQMANIFAINGDGTFRIDDVPAGKYTLETSIRQIDAEINFAETLATSTSSVDMPEGSPVDPAVDVGAIPMTVVKSLRPGEVATPFDFASLDGKIHNVADYRGKYFMIVWWRTESGFNSNASEFRKYFSKFENDPRLKMTWLCIQDGDQAESAAKEFNLTAEVTRAEVSEIPNEYHPCPVTACLIDPQGKVVKKFLMGEKGAKFVSKVLGAK